jgi:hypothetical protein
MDKTQHLLTILMEECAEVSQRASKALRFGLKEQQSELHPPNDERLTYEFADLLAVYRCLVDLGLLKTPSPEDLEKKRMKLEEYTKYSQSLGIVDPD